MSGDDDRVDLKELSDGVTERGYELWIDLGQYEVADSFLGGFESFGGAFAAGIDADELLIGKYGHNRVGGGW